MKMHRRFAVNIVCQLDRSLFTILVNQHTGAEATLGRFLMTLILLGLWRQEQFALLKNKLRNDEY